MEGGYSKLTLSPSVDDELHIMRFVLSLCELSQEAVYKQQTENVHLRELSQEAVYTNGKHAPA
jgi:hypothetical protein